MTILVLSGGPDAERPVSIASGREVAEALRRCGRYTVLEQVIDRPGPAELAAMGGDVIFPVLHGSWGEGGGLQEVLERVGLPYVGSRPRAARRAMDKLLTKSLLAPLGVQTPPARQLMPDDPCDLPPPLVLKPVDDGSSVDLAVCTTRDEVEAARRRLHARRGRLMAERYIPGAELTVGIVLGKPLPIVRIEPAGGLYDYAAKYDRDDTRYEIDPPLPGGVAERCRAVSMLAWNELGCRDIARVDFMLEGETPWFLEINTMPGFTTHSLVPMAAAHAGTDMPALCSALVEAAAGRSREAAGRRESGIRG